MSENDTNVVESVNDLTSYASPKELIKTLSKMYIAWSHTENADCKVDRKETTDVYGHLLTFFSDLEENKK